MIHLRHEPPQRIRFIAVLSVSAIVLGGCGLGTCANEEVKRVASSDGTLEAAMFQRNCGATTDLSTQVSVVRANAKLPNSGGNAYIADCDHGRAPVAKWGGPPADVRWLDTRTIEVRYHPASRGFSKSSSVAVRTGWLHSETVSVRFVTGVDTPPNTGLEPTAKSAAAQARR
jgi:hypothetical protein